MLSFLKLLIYLAIIMIIAILNNVDMTHAKSLSKMSNLMKMDDPPQNPPQFESIISRIRRDVDLQADDGADIPKEQIHAGLIQRTRRQAPPEESDIPEGFHKDTETLRAKRQMPSPPDFPMPPI